MADYGQMWDVPGMVVLFGNPRILIHRDIAVYHHRPSRDVPGMAVYLGIPGYLDRGIAVHYIP